MRWAFILISLASSPGLMAETSLEWLLSKALRYEDITPKNLRTTPLFIDRIEGRLIYSEPTQDKTGQCPGKRLYLQNESGNAMVSNASELECIVGLRSVKDTIYAHVRVNSRERLLAITLGADHEFRIKNAISESLDGEASNDATARLKWEIDRLRVKQETAISRKATPVLHLQLLEDRVKLFWVITSDQENLCFQDAFMLGSGTALTPAPTQIACAKRSKRKLTELFSTPQGDTFLFWQGGRTEMGRIVRTQSKSSEAIGSETIIDPPEWTRVPESKFAIRSPGNAALLPDGFISYESSRSFTFDDPFTFFYDFKNRTFVRLPYLSLPYQQLAWIRTEETGLLVSFTDLDEKRPKIWWISEQAKGELVDKL